MDLYANSLSPNHVNYWNKTAICISIRHFCQCSSVGRMPPRDGPGNLHSNPSLNRANFSLTFKSVKLQRPELVFVSRTQISLPVLRVSQHEGQSCITMSVPTYGKCLFIFVRHFRSPAPPCTPWAHSCPMSIPLCMANTPQLENSFHLKSISSNS